MAADARSTTFAGASEIKATPMTTSTADPIRNPVRWLGISRPSIDIATACAKLDHAAKAIRLRFADGFRTAMSRKMPSVTYRLSIIVTAVSYLTGISNEQITA